MTRKQAERLILARQSVTLYDVCYQEYIIGIPESQTRTALHVRLPNNRLGVFCRRELKEAHND